MGGLELLARIMTMNTEWELAFLTHHHAHQVNLIARIAAGMTNLLAKRRTIPMEETALTIIAR